MCAAHCHFLAHFRIRAPLRMFHRLCSPGVTFIGKVQNWRPITARPAVMYGDKCQDKAPRLYSCTSILALDVICTGLQVLFTGQILHKQLLNLLKSTVYTITNVARCSARQLRAPPQHSPYAPAAPTRLAGQGRTHRHHLPLPPYSLSESLAAKAQPQ